MSPLAELANAMRHVPAVWLVIAVAFHGRLAYPACMHERRLGKATALGLGVVAACASVSLAAKVSSAQSISVRPSVPVGTVQLAAEAPDPSGGLRWGLRLIQKRPLAACLQIGRVRHGRIGALGQDGSYGKRRAVPSGPTDPELPV